MMTGSGGRRRIKPGRRVAILLGLLAALPFLYLLGALAGSLIPANREWREPPTGITIFVETNGVHSAIILPARAAGLDWSRLIRPEHLGRPEMAGDHLAFGWGHREFYLKTPTWSDLRIDTAARALLGLGGTLMHVDHLEGPRPHASRRTVTVTPAQYRRLSAFILASFERGAVDQPIQGYSDSDLFYPARGRYNLFRTSNQWTGAALRHAGIRMGIWTPFAPGVMRWFPRSGP
jgi:uncharacterized protein (TIGR02117 family)